jgi:hypothetical protein
MLEPLARDRRSAQTRAEAQTLLEKVATSEEQAALQRKAAQTLTPADATNTLAATGGGAATTGAAASGGASVSMSSGVSSGDAAGATRQEGDTAAATHGAAEAQPCDMPQPGPQFKHLRFDGQQACGQLVSVECDDAAGVTLLVETPHGTLKLRSPALNRIRFVSYTADVRGRVECGLRTRANPVLVTYRPPKDARLADGEVIAVEFVPPDWVH